MISNTAGQRYRRSVVAADCNGGYSVCVSSQANCKRVEPSWCGLRVSAISRHYEANSSVRGERCLQVWGGIGGRSGHSASLRPRPEPQVCYLPAQLSHSTETPMFVPYSSVCTSVHLHCLPHSRSAVCRGFVCMHHFARKAGFKRPSLRVLTAILLGQHLTKSQQRSNWGRDVLNDSQVAYAAADAWASREVALKLQPLWLPVAKGSKR